jgi:hypothetical protein
MKYLILTVLLAVMQAPPPVPGKAPDSAASTRQNTIKKARDDQTPTTQPVPAITANETPARKPDGPNQGNDDADHPVSISKLPTVTVSPTKRDWADWGYWGFSLLLAIVGGFQVWLLVRTLKISIRQAEIAEKQMTQMVRAGEQTERIIGQMRESTKRQLRAYLGVSECGLKLENRAIPEGQVNIKNFGQTPAYNVRQWIGIAVFPHPLPVKLPERPDGLPSSVSVVPPSGDHINVVPVKSAIPADLQFLLYTPEHTVYVFGRVMYEDIFGGEWTTDYRFFCGGPEGLRTKKDSRGVLLGLMQPDSEGNTAT